MSRTYLDPKDLPFCKGCSHHSIARNTDKALAKLGVDPLDVILVSDIGCQGIVDKHFYTHTVHGLHGRSVALAAGISAAVSNPEKKVIVFIGDGGATIGINHIVAAAHRNFDITVIVHNNMLYGMTGGQQSDLTPGSFCTETRMSGFTESNLDLAEVVSASGAAYVSRIEARGDFSDEILEALQSPGFSMLEVLEVCPSYGAKYNDDLKTKGMAERFGIPLLKRRNESAEPAMLTNSRETRSLFDSLKRQAIEFEHEMTREVTIVFGGSAGGGVQSAANILATAALSCGLHVVKRGHYPVTVGIGYSVSEVIISPQEILFDGVRSVDYVLLSSQDGTDFLEKKIRRFSNSFILKDNSVEFENESMTVKSADFGAPINKREINLAMLISFFSSSKLIPVDAIIAAITNSRLGKRIDVNDLVNHLKTIPIN